MATQTQTTKPKRNRRSNKQSIPTSFECYLKLPYELRSMIWKHACHVPRDIDLRRHQQGGINLCEILSDPLAGHFWPHSFHSHVPPPSILHVSQEARKEGLRWYHLEFGTNMKVGGLSYVLPPKIYINWPVDRLLVMDAATFVYTGDRDMPIPEYCRKNGLSHLAFSCKNFSSSGHHHDCLIIAEALHRMGLETLILFHEKWSRQCAQFRFEEFLARKKDGTVIKNRNPTIWLKLCNDEDELIQAWDKYEADIKVANRQRDADGNAPQQVELLPRPKIELMRFLIPRERQV